MAFAGATLSLIRSVFNRDKIVTQPSHMNPFLDPYSRIQGGAKAIEGPVSGHNSYMGQQTQINTDLMSRYADYQDMATYPELGVALHIFADEATQQSAIHGRSVWFYSQDETIQSILDYTFHKQLKIEKDLWSMAHQLCQYGNNLEEIVVFDGVGVVKLIHNRPEEIRRIEDEDGNLYGFMKDKRLEFGMQTTEFMNRLYNKDVTNKETQHIKVFEPWEVAHFRLMQGGRTDLYGSSIYEQARWVWKRLQMMEDAMVLYKLCLRGDSDIWTPNGVVKIKDLEEGDEVYSFGENKELKRSKVVYKKNNGIDQIYRVSSVHRDLFANATHPVLVEEIVRQGSGKPVLRTLRYIEVKNLVPGKHRFVTPRKELQDFDVITIARPVVGKKARVRSSAIEEGFCRNIPWTEVQKCGVSQPYAQRFFEGESWLKYEAAVRLCEANGYGEDILELKEDWGGIDEINIPDTVDEKFAQWFGFMIGDGYLADFYHDGHRHQRVGFSCGDDQETNEKYKSLFEEIVGEANFAGDTGYRLGYYQVASKEFAEFMRLNGFIGGAHNKRIPEWVFRASYSIKQAFLVGLCDADAHWEPMTVSKIRNRVRHERARLELCNRELVEDVRTLCMQMGLVTTKIYTRFREGGRVIKNSDVALKDRKSYWLDIVFKEMPLSEEIRSVESVGDDEIWDIGVDVDEHNFVADGVVVHNTRSPQRYVFYVDTGDVPPNEARKILNKVKQDFKKEKFIDPETGKPNFRFNPLSIDEDYFISQRKGKRSTEIDILSGLDGQQVDDAEYFRDKMFTAIGIPKSYMAADETIGRSNLGQMDLRFAKSVLRVQRELKNGIRHIGNVDLAARNIDPDRVDFDVRMVVPSGVLEIAHIEVERAKTELAQMYQSLNVSEYYIWSHILGISDEEISDIKTQREKEQEAMLAMGGPDQDMGSGAGGGAAPASTAVAAEPPLEPSGAEGGTPESIERNIYRQKKLVSHREMAVKNQILDEMAKNQTNLGRRLNELKSLVSEIKSANRNGRRR
jgi:intein/homing endonuclease